MPGFGFFSDTILLMVSFEEHIRHSLACMGYGKSGNTSTGTWLCNAMLRVTL